MVDARKNALLIKSLAEKHGFDFCGISKAGFLEKEADRMEKWLSQGHHGEMQYLENHFDKRLDPCKLVPGAKSVISLMYNYFPEKSLESEAYKLAKYAYGKDYHDVVKEKCKAMLLDLQMQVGGIEGRAFVDSAPVMERAWAEKSGLGWIGKHGLLINKQKGSFFFLAELIIDLDCESDSPIKDYCGSCTKCIDACPTEAILPNKTLNASKCISYLTIELKNEIPSAFKDQMNNWIFGCDICQDVCPWNRFSEPSKEMAFMPDEQLQNLSTSDWEEISEEVFSKIFKGSAVKRTGFKGLKRNIEFVKRS